MASKNFKPVEVHYLDTSNQLQNSGISRLIATMGEDGQYCVNVSTLYEEDNVGLLAAIAQCMAELTEGDAEELLRQARKSVKWSRRAARIYGWGRPQEAV